MNYIYFFLKELKFIFKTKCIFIKYTENTFKPNVLRIKSLKKEK